MKFILFLLLIVLSFNSQAQIHISSYPDSSFYAVIKNNSDTFEIQQLGKIHFIKIDGELYEVIRKMELKKVEPVNHLGNLSNGAYFEAIPNFQWDKAILTDSTTSRWITGPPTFQSGKIQKTKPKTKKK